jgi:hypothetical protein
MKKLLEAGCIRCSHRAPMLFGKMTTRRATQCRQIAG